MKLTVPKLRGRRISEEEKKHLSESKKRWWREATPEQLEQHRKRSSERMKKLWRRALETETVIHEYDETVEALEYELQKARSGTKIYLPAKRTTNERRKHKRQD